MFRHRERFLPGMDRCNLCSLVCPLSDFQRRKNGSLRYECKACRAETNKQWRTANKDWVESYYQRVGRERSRKWMGEHTRGMRTRAIDHLGAKCATCGFADRRVLQIDHVHGGGREEMKRIGRWPTTFYRKVIASAPGAEYQALCPNCNTRKIALRDEFPYAAERAARGCETNIRNVWAKKWYANLRAEVLEKYGAACARCGECDRRVLQMDHVNGGGTAEAKASTSRTAYLRRMLADTTGAYQVLCATCNRLKVVEQNECKGRPTIRTA